MICPICNEHELLFYFGLIICAKCHKAWTEVEFLGDLRANGIPYHFEGDTCIITKEVAV